MTQDEARELRVATERDCGCRIPYPYNEVAEFAIQASHEAGRREMREEAAARCEKAALAAEMMGEGPGPGYARLAARAEAARALATAIRALPTVAGEK